MNASIDRPLCLLVVVLVVASAACHSKPPATRRYPFTGRVVSIDPKSQSAVIDGDLIQGFMLPMTMTYKLKPASALRQLAPGDSISAEVVVVDQDPRDETAEADYWLENVKVIAPAKSPPAHASITHCLPIAALIIVLPASTRFL